MPKKIAFFQYLIQYINIFAAKMWVQKLLIFFQQKISMYLPYVKIEILMST